MFISTQRPKDTKSVGSLQLAVINNQSLQYALQLRYHWQTPKKVVISTGAYRFSPMAQWRNLSRQISRLRCTPLEM